jgi:hypothetical protein
VDYTVLDMPQILISPGLARPNIMPLKSDTEVKVLTCNRRFLPKSEPSRTVRIYHARGNPPRTAELIGWHMFAYSVPNQFGESDHHM